MSCALGFEAWRGRCRLTSKVESVPTAYASFFPSVRLRSRASFRFEIGIAGKASYLVTQAQPLPSLRARVPGAAARNVPGSNNEIAMLARRSWCAVAYMTRLSCSVYRGSSLVQVTRHAPLNMSIQPFSSQREGGVASCMQACCVDWFSVRSSAKTSLGLGFDLTFVADT